MLTLRASDELTCQHTLLVISQWEGGANHAGTFMCQRIFGQRGVAVTGVAFIFVKTIAVAKRIWKKGNHWQTDIIMSKAITLHTSKVWIIVTWRTWTVCLLICYCKHMNGSSSLDLNVWQSMWNKSVRSKWTKKLASKSKDIKCEQMKYFIQQDPASQQEQKKQIQRNDWFKEITK